MNIRILIIDRCKVKFEISRMDNRSLGSMKNNPKTIGDAMIGFEKVDVMLPSSIVESEVISISLVLASKPASLSFTSISPTVKRVA